MAEAAQARPTTKLLDSAALPKLEVPTHPFHRLKRPLKIHQSPENEAERNKKRKRESKRPLPEKRWRKRISLEDYHLEDSGMSIVLFGVEWYL